MSKLAKAIINVMKAVNGIEKNATVGTGSYQYKGVNDQDVKVIYKKAMQENGLCILPIEIEPKTQIDRWQEETNYGTKQKQSVFTEVKVKYLLMHESGESEEIVGYGQGIDVGDKGAGKATTYAMKYALLYTFMTPTGEIADADKTDSKKLPKPKSDNAALINKALKDVNNSKNIQQLTSVWEKYRNELGESEVFVSAVKEHRKEVEKTPKK